MGSGRGPSDAVSPALLTSYIKNARTIEALFKTCSEHKSSLNHIHLSACWTSLGHLARAAGQSWAKEHAKGLESLVGQTKRAVLSEEVQARQLVNVAHGLARSVGRQSGGRGQSLDALLKALATSIERRLGDCNAQELANAAWALAKAGHFSAELFAAMAKVAAGRAGDFNAQELANILWAVATAGHSDDRLFAALAGAVERRLDDFNTQGFANAAWAFAKAGHLDAKLFAAMARSAEWRANDFNAQDVAHTAWAFAKAGHVDAQLFAALARSAEWSLGSFNAQGLANVAWAFAKAGHADEQLFAALARSAELRLGDFNAQDLASTAWAFAKACRPDAQLFAALARSAEPRLAEFNAQDLANTAWAFAKLGQPDARLFQALAKLIGRRLGDLSAQHLAGIAWAFAKAGHPDAQLFAAMAESAERRAGDFSAADLADTAWAFANAGHLDARLFAALARSAERLAAAFSEEELDNTAWALAKAGLQGAAKRLRQQGGAPAPAPAGPADVSGCGRIVVAGGGIGGAALAVALQSRGFDVVVLEADASFDARKQGYGLTVQRTDAVQALGVSLAQDDAPATSHYIFSSEGHILGVFGEAFRQGRERRAAAAGAGRFVHTPRQALRARILERIRPGTIRWSSSLEGFSCRGGEGGGGGGGGGGGVTVALKDGTTMDAALLVGADGIFSTVRRQLGLPGDRLNYLGLVVVLGMVPTAGAGGDGEGGEDAAAPPLPQRRIFETVDGVTRIYAMPFTATSTMWQLSFPYGEKAARALAKDPAGLKKEILRRCGGWHEPVPSLLRRTPLDCMSGYPVYDRDPLEPEVLRPPRAAAAGAPAPQRRVTVLGDAAHPMCPFRAQGANQALGDAVLLAEALEDGVRRHGPRAGLDAALPLFERKMLRRSARIVVASREKAKELHSDLALRPARKVQREAGADMPEIIRELRARGIGAHSAADPRGLDAQVAEVIDASSLGGCAPAPQDAPAEGAAEGGKRRGAAERGADAAEAKKRRKAAKPAAAAAAKEEGRGPGAEPQLDWWKALTFDGYTGEQWEAWYSQEGAGG